MRNNIDCEEDRPTEEHDPCDRVFCTSRKNGIKFGSEGDDDGQ
jgi:hypothetical protein